MATALNKKIGKREGLRLVLTTTVKSAQDYLTGEDIQRSRLVGFKRTVQEVLKQLESANEDVIKGLEADKIGEDIVESFTYVQSANDLEASIDIKMQELVLKDSPVSSSVSSIASSSNRQTCRLPKMELPSFKGDPLLWQGFWDQYNVAIHENESLTDIDRFNYLKRFLSGEALRSVSGLTLNSENYQEAIQILKDRYGNEQILISAHMEALLKMNKVRGRDDLKNLRKLYNDVENCLRNLKALKMETAAYGSLLIPILKERLPDDLLLTISRKFGSQVWDLDSMMQHFNEELRAYENCVVSKTSGEGVKKEKERHSPYTTSGMYVQGQSQSQLRCLYCTKGHSSSQCRTITNPRARKGIVIRKGRCFICLGSDHLAKECSSSYACRKCKGRHHVSLCFANPGKKDEQKEKEKEDPEVEETVGSHIQTKGGILLQTAKASVCGEITSTDTRLLFDTGSQRTYASEDVVQRLKLKTVRTERVMIKTFGSEEAKVKKLKVVRFKVKRKVGKGYIDCEALCVPIVCSPIAKQDVDYAGRNFEHLDGLTLADSNEGHAEVEILIGSDFYHEFFTGKYKKGCSGPVASESCLGWVLSGPLGNKFGTIQNCSLVETHLLRCLTEDCDRDTLKEDLKKFWEVDKVGEVGEDGCEEIDVVSKFEKEIYHDGKRYVSKLPFKPNHDELPDNFSVSKRRLENVRKRLKASGILNDYDQIIKDYEKDSIIEKVPEEEIAKDRGKVHYLPHRAVVKENRETTKIRIVFDASCGVNGPSLNECLYPGPNMLAKIFDILLRFRLNRIAITADIKQAFLNVGIHPEHRDFLRFLWHSSDNEVEIFRFRRVVFGLTSSPFLLNATIKQHVEKEKDVFFVKKFLNALYVDDEASGCENVAEGKEFYRKAVKVLATAGLDLRKWKSNDRELQKFFDEQVIEPKCDGVVDESFCKSQLGQKTVSSNKVLGMDWDKETDSLVVCLSEFVVKCRSTVLTKRNILSVSASLYDPLGLISPITAWMKTIFQLLCKDSLEWDCEVSEEIREAWFRFVDVVASVGKVTVERFVLVPADLIRGCELHGFCDSSSEVYCAVVYLRVLMGTDVKTSLLASKTKVAPIKVVTIPRLELLSCLLLSRLVRDIERAFLKSVDLQRIHCWTDSEVARSWIKGKEKAWKGWVENRVVKIRQVVDRGGWSHVAGDENPADIPTRKLSGFDGLLQDRWFKGPSFLSSSDFQSNLSTSDSFDDIITNLSSCELYDDIMKESIDLTETDNNVTTTLTMTKIPATNLQAIIEYERFGSLEKLISILSYVRRFIENLRKKKKGKPLSLDTLLTEERKDTMELIIANEQHQLKGLENYQKLKSSLNLFEDQKGLLRLRGRFGNSTLQYQEKHPLILRTDSVFTELLIKETHEKVFHHGVESTLAHLRTNYWIVRGRKTVKNLLYKCTLCKRYQGKTISPPASPDLPDFRLSFNAFNATGLDYAGPLYVQSEDKKETQKVYILLLTCAGTRAIHLEVCPDMKNSAFIRAFKRFSSRRGVPCVVIHDNFKTFKSKEVKLFFSQQDIEQQFILPSSPLVGWNVRASCAQRESIFKENIRFEKVYLQELRQNNIYRKNTDNDVKLRVGEVILIKGEKMVPRAEWRTGIVEELVKGRDGKIRGAKIKTTSKKDIQHPFTDPVQKLIKLEIEGDKAEQTLKEKPKVDKHVESTRSRPTRRAAIEGVLRRLKNTK
ncbi:uncharacterized protein [Clytia hemisphaerica]|uniref:uncharacterized protein n=1 Tax=Clytia hemisphaerica TaxID=252671 RepID=UPI0034D44DF3